MKREFFLKDAPIYIRFLMALIMPFIVLLVSTIVVVTCVMVAVSMPYLCIFKPEKIRWSQKE